MALSPRVPAASPNHWLLKFPLCAISSILSEGRLDAFPSTHCAASPPAASSAWNIFSIFSSAALEVTALKNVSIVTLTEAERQVREDG